MRNPGMDALRRYLGICRYVSRAASALPRLSSKHPLWPKRKTFSVSATWLTSARLEPGWNEDCRWRRHRPSQHRLLSGWRAGQTSPGLKGLLNREGGIGYEKHDHQITPTTDTGPRTPTALVDGVRAGGPTGNTTGQE